MIDFNELPALLSVPRTAKILGLSRSSTYRFVESGVLPSRRLGERVYVPTAKLREFIEGDDQAAGDDVEVAA